jgi:hypothetical protein
VGALGGAGGGYAGEGAGWVVKAVEGLQRATGLRVGEALGASREVVGRVEKVA